MFCLIKLRTKEIQGQTLFLRLSFGRAGQEILLCSQPMSKSIISLYRKQEKHRRNKIHKALSTMSSKTTNTLFKERQANDKIPGNMFKW